jgi:hypothetical protein
VREVRCADVEAAVSQALLLTLPASERAALLAECDPTGRRALLGEVVAKHGTIWPVWRDDPLGFVLDGLGETVWSRQREMLERVGESRKLAVAATHEVSKSFTAARIVAWFILTRPVGTAKVMATADTWARAKVIWPHLHMLHRRHNLPGRMLQMAWQIDGIEVAFGRSFANHAPDTVQGEHAPEFMLVVDEAGGIPMQVGRSFEGLLTSDGTNALAIGNPSLQPETWFERISTSDEWDHLTIAATESPNVTGEETARCSTCPEGVEPHTIATHLVSKAWCFLQAQDWGEDSPWYQSHVLARFVRDNPLAIIPVGALEHVRARAVEPTDDDPNPDWWLAHRPPAEHDLARLPVTLGIDFAFGGGDELAIARVEGSLGRVVFHYSGTELSDQNRAAGLCLQHILDAEELHRSLGGQGRVRVKVDASGAGVGPASTLEGWGREGIHTAKIIRVQFAGRARQSERFHDCKAEMFWGMRERVTAGDCALDIDDVTMAQLAAPRQDSDTSGRVRVEEKESIRRRGLRSPDRAEALCLAFYEPGVAEEVGSPAGRMQPRYDPRRR